VGEDLSEQENGAVETHLRTCLPCRIRAEALRRSRQAIIQCRSIAGEVEELLPSVWPALKAQLVDRHPDRDTGPSWLPVGAMVAACMAIAVVVWNRPAAVHAFPVTFQGTLSANADLEPDWAAGLSSPTFEARSEVEGWPEATTKRGTYFHLESAVPVGLSAGDF
jgi:hypothetical protein